MKPFFIIYFFLVATVLVVFGFRGTITTKAPIEIFPDMDRQSKFSEQGRTQLFDDESMQRPRVPGSVPHITDMQETFDHLMPDDRYRENPYLVSGKLTDGSFGDGMPIEIDRTVMEEGQELYNIFCMVCHGESGNGKGVVADPRYGYPTIISIVQERIRNQPDGEIYNTITNGKNTMMPYGHKLQIEDRWKVVLYVRALQRAAHATVDDVPPQNREELGL